jgi:hypothetical protein
MEPNEFPPNGRSIGTFYTKEMHDKLVDLMETFPRSEFPNLRMGTIQTAVVKIGLEAENLHERVKEYIFRERPDKTVAKAAALISGLTDEQREQLLRSLQGVGAAGTNVEASQDTSLL